MKLKTLSILLAVAWMYNATSHAQRIKDVKSTHVITYKGADENGSWIVNKTLNQDGVVLAYDSSYVHKEHEGLARLRPTGDPDAFFRYFKDPVGAFPDRRSFNWGETDSLAMSDSDWVRRFQLDGNLEEQFPEIKEMMEQMAKMQESFWNNQYHLQPPPPDRRSNKESRKQEIKDRSIDM